MCIRDRQLCDHLLWEDWDRPLTKILRFLVEPMADSLDLLSEGCSRCNDTVPAIDLRSPAIDLTLEDTDHRQVA